MNRRIRNRTYGGVRGRENLFNFPSYSITKKSQKGIKNYDESNGKKTGSTKKPGENFKENDGLSEESRADGQQKKNEPSHDQKGVKAYDEQKRIL